MQKENESDQLKKALSDSQLAIFEERKHVLRLISENDELKSTFRNELSVANDILVRELDDRRKIQYLLALCGTSPEDGTTYFREKIPNDTITPTEETVKPILDHKDAQEKFKETEIGLENQSLKLRLSALQTQLDEQVLFIFSFTM